MTKEKKEAIIDVIGTLFAMILVIAMLWLFA